MRINDFVDALDISYDKRNPDRKVMFIPTEKVISSSIPLYKTCTIELYFHDKATRSNMLIHTTSVTDRCAKGDEEKLQLKCEKKFISELLDEIEDVFKL